jgi:hypothetical protein
MSSPKFDQHFQAMSKSKSLYIPLLPKDLVMPTGNHLYEESVLRDFFERIIFVGKVARIDYVTKATKVDSHAIAVFIHFEHWNRSPDMDKIIEMMNEDGEATFHGYWDHLRGYSVPFVSSFNGKKRFFKVKVNRSPIPAVVDVPTNMTQIVHDNSTMRSILQEKDARIVELEEEVKRLTAMIHAHSSLQYEPNTEVMTADELNL